LLETKKLYWEITQTAINITGTINNKGI